ncbi:MAG: ABC transporter ATP-binding protein [Bacilli bacterium]
MLSVKRLAFAYSKKSPWVLKDVSFVLEEKKVGILLGRNGSGKSTLFKCLMGLEKPFGGSMLFNGKELARMKRADRAKAIAYVPQAISFGEMSVFDTVLSGRLAHFGYFPGKRDQAIVEGILEEMGLKELAFRNVNCLSGGERQKVAIARALAQEPALLIFDEPTGNLDITNEELILRESRRLAHEKGVSVLVSIHDLSLASLFGDTFYLLKDGKIACSGGVDVLTSAALSEIYGINVLVEDIRGRKFITLGGEKDEK